MTHLFYHNFWMNQLFNLPILQCLNISLYRTQTEIQIAHCSKLRAVILIYFVYYTINWMCRRPHCTYERTRVEDLQKTHLRSRRNHSSSTQNRTNVTSRVCVCVPLFSSYRERLSVFHIKARSPVIPSKTEIKVH